MKIQIQSVGEVTLLAMADLGTQNGCDVVVLVDRGTDHDQYVTWRLWEGTGNYVGQYVAFWGHYFSDRDRAAQDFFERAGQSHVAPV